MAVVISNTVVHIEDIQICVYKICTNWFVWECELRLYNYDTCTEIKTTLFRIWNIFRWISSIRKAELCLQSSPKPLNGYHSYVRQSCVCNPAQNYSMDIIKLNAMVKHKESSGYNKSISAINSYCPQLLILVQSITVTRALFDFIY